MERFLSHSLFKNWNSIPDRKVPTISPSLWFLVQQKQAEARQSTLLLCSKSERPLLPLSQWPCERLLLFVPLLKACSQHQKQQAGLTVPKAACQPSPVSAGLHCHCIIITETMSKVCFADISFLRGLATTWHLSVSCSSAVDQEFRNVHQRNQGGFNLLWLAKRWLNPWILSAFTIQVSCNSHIFLK